MTTYPPGKAVVREAVQPVFEAEGLHLVVARLNGLEAGRLPLMVKVAAQEQTSVF